jgi:phosphoglycerate dehydrogenase-like enzyme
MNFVAIKSICNLDQFLGSATSGKSIFGMQVVAVTKNPFLKKPGIDKVYFVDNLGGPEILPESIARADYVSLHTPLTEETRNMIGAKELGLMKKSAFLVNAARAFIVDREALFTVLWMILLEYMHFCC